MSWVMNRLLQHKTDWELSPGSSGGVCANMPVAGVGICAGGGSLRASRGTTTQATLAYSILTRGVGISISLVGSIYGSLEHWPSGNPGGLWTRSGASSFQLSDLYGHMMVLSVSKGNVGASSDLSVHFFGVPQLVARHAGSSNFGPAAAMATAKAVGIVWGITMRTEIHVGGISLGTGYLLDISRD